MGFISQPPQAGITSSIDASGVNAGTNVAVLAATVPTADGDIALVPKVGGALLAEVPTGTAAGGNKRGIGSVDWQTSRTAANEVASGGRAVIAGGENNRGNGPWSVTGGGFGNINAGTYGVVAGGTQNSNSGQYASVGGGFTNVIGVATGATIAGGQGNNIPINANYGTIGGGLNNNVDRPNGTIPGGSGASTRLTDGRFSYASSSTLGRAQLSELVTKNQTTDATPTILTVDAAAPAPNNTCMLGANSANAFEALVAGRNNVTGDCAMFHIRGGIKMGASAATAAIVGVPVVTALGADAGAAAWAVAVGADTVRGSLQITVTGAAGSTIQWSARLSLCEVTF